MTKFIQLHAAIAAYAAIASLGILLIKKSQNTINIWPDTLTMGVVILAIGIVLFVGEMALRSAKVLDQATKTDSTTAERILLGASCLTITTISQAIFVAAIVLPLQGQGII